jgi:AraC family transcriptional regulator of adaptative response/methylated-DNA-[protein]-cysteine methyltransferase
MLDQDALRWEALLARDPAPDCGAFLYAVTTQGVYCRPGCPSRSPFGSQRLQARNPAASAAGASA